MKTRTYGVLARLALLALLALTVLAAGYSHAQSLIAARADVPFNFIVGTEALPAGQYAIQWNSSLLTLTNRATGGTIMSLGRLENVRKGQQCKIVFNHYGDRYFFSKVVVPATGLVAQVTPTSVERAMAAHEGNKEALLTSPIAGTIH